MRTTKKEASPEPTHQDFPIVGIGASAGGLEAFRQFLSAITEDSGMAYVIVQHLDPSHESMLPDILSRCTNLPVHEITDEIHLAPNNIYVIPENKILTSTDGILQLTPRGDDKRNRAINVFFKSLAEIHQNLAVGVVLSGTGTDGTQGLKDIKEHGGITFAQDQASATYGEMPQNAVDANAADFELTAKEIPTKLLEIWSEKFAAKESLSPVEVSSFQEIISLLSKYSGVDFKHYKDSTVKRRMTRQMSLNNISSLDDYLVFLGDNKEAITALFNDLLIPVTSFFRDPKIFDEITKVVFPALLEKNAQSKSIRIWSAGCSTGEEAYSLAISLLEVIGEQNESIQIKIFASDISALSIDTARTGFYKKAQLANLTEDILAKYFTKKNDGFQINRNVRNLCIFVQHNFLKDPPFSKMDLISCRNVLIYMDSFLQKKALSTFHYSLSDGGYLLLGKSETVLQSAVLFSPLTKTSKIFTRKKVSGQFPYQTDGTDQAVAQLKPKIIHSNLPKADFLKSAEALLMTSYMPASVIVNEQHDVVHFNGNVNLYLGVSTGKATLNILKIAKEGLAFELRNTLRKAEESKLPILRKGIQVEFDDGFAEVSIEAQLLSDTAEPHYLVIFQKTPVPQHTVANISDADVDANFQKRMRILEQELLQTHSDVNAITEELETSNLELQSANEELLSGSEELQSLNEELETSKEELQSSNEELNIINEELLIKQDEITIAREYTESIVATLREPLVILDTRLRIKTINHAFATKYNITNQEAEGQLIYEILGHLFSNLVMQDLLEKVLSEKSRLEDYQITVKLQPDEESIMLLNARQVTNEKSNEKLILLAIEDVTERKKVKKRLQVLSDGFETSVKERTSELETSLTELNKANVRLQQFAYIASHDLQEPLRKILMFTSILQQENALSDSGAVLVNKINIASDRMKMLINDLLTYSYLSDDNALFVPTDLNLTLKNILVDFEMLIEEKDVEFISGTLPTIIAIPLQMNQLFYNMISNSLKFLQKDVPAKIEISSSMLSTKQMEKYPELNKDLSWCEIIFKDNGIGFDQQYERKIFTIFQRLHSAEAFAGTGIGLTISSKIVENHNGIIFAKSELNKGAAFHVILPISVQ